MSQIPGKRLPAWTATLLLATVVWILLALGPARADASPRVCAYVAGPWPNLSPPAGRSITGHSFIQLLPDSGPQAGSKKLVYGFSTRDSVLWRALGGSGEVQDDSAHPWTWRMCSTVSEGQYDRVQAKVTHEIKNPPPYHLFDFNCTDWVLGLVREGGYPFPPVPRTSNRIRELLDRTFGWTPGGVLASSIFKGAVFSDPYTMELRFREIGDGKLYGPDSYVNKDKTNSLPTQVARGAAAAAAAEPDIDSPARIGHMALHNPARFGREFGIDPVIRHRPTRGVGEGDRLALDFDQIGDRRSMVVVNWGDGADRFDDSLAGHRYREPGRYRVRAAVLRGATLMRIDFTAVVRARDDARRVSIDVPRVDRPKAGPDDDDPIIPKPLG